MTMRVLSLGACQLSAPINSLVKEGRIDDCWLASGQPTVTCYCVGDAMQVLRIYRRQIDLSEGMRCYSGYPDNDLESVGRRRLDDADIAVLDCNTPIAMCLDGIFINRSSITREIYQPLAAANPDLGKTYDAWWHQGIFGGDEEVKRSSALALIPSLEGVVRYPKVAAEILLGMRAVRQDDDDFIRALDELHRELAMPLGMVTSTYRYLPDGRAVSWPPRHLEMTRNAARELHIPLFDTIPLVQQHGVSIAMNDNLTIYRTEFWPVVGDALLSFMNDVLSGAMATEVPQRESA